ncbi:hypothetical protein GCM10010435_29900 [Winogradskya consettensis]|uniref:Metallophosphoesterase n=1 Tax=Winogradskya consettensis TaxID=113560 RepID=A0A919VP97_9ACTN|nr:hypothetical protein Aco04nite_21600 [Actinoplanes consettensis]
MSPLSVLAAVVVPIVFGTLHWYLWRRLVAETTSRGSWARRAGSTVFIAGPVVAASALIGGFTSMPMAVQRVLAWSGYLWLAVFLYLLLAVLAGELVRPLLNRWVTHRCRGTAVASRPATRRGPARRRPDFQFRRRTARPSVNLSWLLDYRPSARKNSATEWNTDTRWRIH